MNRLACFSLLALLLPLSTTALAVPDAPAMAPPASTRLLIDHVNGYTLDSAGKLQHFEALLVDAGKVLATGSHDALSTRAAGATVIDGKGRNLLPGLIDAHGHVLGLGEVRTQGDLVGTASLDAALKKIKEFAALHPKDPWVLDATGAATFEMRQFSQLEGWTPTKVFNERNQFTPADGGSQPSSAHHE